ncbi:MAG: GNAT family N-acetyltransferase [Planctomycetes bacterium]|nr:GNAT family N-acetyltransferase [Planctomycetota bacterium]
MGIVFRSARVADAENLLGLVEELGYPSALERLQARLAQLSTRPEHALFVVEDAGALLGWIHVQEFHSLAADPTALVTGLVVDPGARRRGLGGRLLALAEDWARARGLASVRLRARAARVEAHAFYRQRGYVAAKTQLQFRKEL